MGSQPKGISASRGAAVLGLSEFQTPLEVFQKIMEEREPGWNKAHGYTLPPEPDNAAIRWGQAFENAVIRLAETERDREIFYREQFFCCNDTSENGPVISMNEKERENFITCHIDGIYEGEILHEGKTTSAFAFREKWGQPGTDHIPRSYQVQVQHQMLCTGAGEAIVSVLVFPETPDAWEAMGWKPVVETLSTGKTYYTLNRNCEPGDSKPVDIVQVEYWARALSEMGYFHQYPVQANREAQRRMVEAYREFWEKHILTGIPPEPRNYDDIKRLCPEPKSTIIVPDYIEHKIAEYKGITEETARAKNRKERLKTIITKYAAEHEGVLDDESKEAVIFRNSSGGKLGSWSKNKNGTLVFRA